MISKEIFCEVIENLRQQMYLDRKHGEAIAEMFGIPIKCSYNDGFLVKSIMKLLQVHFPKTDDFCRIEFYCDFLEFGKGGDDLITAEELYETLINDLKS